LTNSQYARVVAALILDMRCINLMTIPNTSSAEICKQLTVFSESHYVLVTACGLASCCSPGNASNQYCAGSDRHSIIVHEYSANDKQK